MHRFIVDEFLKHAHTHKCISSLLTNPSNIHRKWEYVDSLPHRYKHGGLFRHGLHQAEFIDSKTTRTGPMSSKGKSSFPLLPLTTGIRFHAFLTEASLSKTRRSVSSRPILIILLLTSFSIYRPTVREPVSLFGSKRSSCVFVGIETEGCTWGMTRLINYFPTTCV